jgi:hypothetical protein
MLESSTVPGATTRLKSNRGIEVPICSSTQLKATLDHLVEVAAAATQTVVCRTRRHSDRRYPRALPPRLMCGVGTHPRPEGYGYGWLAARASSQP